MVFDQYVIKCDETDMSGAYTNEGSICLHDH